MAATAIFIRGGAVLIAIAGRVVRYIVRISLYRADIFQLLSGISCASPAGSVCNIRDSCAFAVQEIEESGERMSDNRNNIGNTKARQDISNGAMGGDAKTSGPTPNDKVDLPDRSQPGPGAIHDGEVGKPGQMEGDGSRTSDEKGD